MGEESIRFFVSLRRLSEFVCEENEWKAEREKEEKKKVAEDGESFKRSEKSFFSEKQISTDPCLFALPTRRRVVITGTTFFVPVSLKRLQKIRLDKFHHEMNRSLYVHLDVSSRKERRQSSCLLLFVSSALNCQETYKSRRHYIESETIAGGKLRKPPNEFPRSFASSALLLLAI